mmetsp:Transcript_27687/g.65008  ORF Transcript_27687/g.65008 Transcript_27687/m.65008 type:complete len:202 (-) Transcript_27687:97-702(-)
MPRSEKPRRRSSVVPVPRCTRQQHIITRDGARRKKFRSSRFPASRRKRSDRARSTSATPCACGRTMPSTILSPTSPGDCRDGTMRKQGCPPPYCAISPYSASTTSSSSSSTLPTSVISASPPVRTGLYAAPANPPSAASARRVRRMKNRWIARDAAAKAAASPARVFGENRNDLARFSGSFTSGSTSFTPCGLSAFLGCAS